MKEMKRVLVVFLSSLVLFTGCKYNDDDLWDEVKNQAERITALEKWSETVNSNISSLQALLDAQQSGDYITGITPVMQGDVEVGYTITFSESPAITIRHGEKGENGDSPAVSVAKDTDEKYYWTVNNEWLLDNNNKIPATGIAPQIRINATSDEWEISTDGGTTWTSTEVKVTGDAIFAKNGIDITDPNNVTFTLANGTTKITLPRTSSVTVAFDSYELLEIPSTGHEITLILPITLKESDFTAIIATVTNENGTGMDIQTRGVATDNVWGVEVTQPTFDSDGNIQAGSAKVKLTPPTAKGSEHKAILKATIVNKEGQEYSVVRPIVKGIIVYVAGYEIINGKSVAMLWKKGEAEGTRLTDGSNTVSAYSVFVSGTNVYVAGYEMINGKTVAMLWKNGVGTQLTDGSNVASANSVSVSGNDVYVAGNETIGSKNVAMLWKKGDTEGTQLTSSSYASALSVSVSGADVYVAGYETIGGKSVAMLWKNGIGTQLTNGSNDANAQSVSISGSDVYVAGYENINGKYVATLWENGVGTQLTNGSSNASALSVSVSGADVYVAGYEYDGSKNVAMLWKKGDTEGTPLTSSNYAYTYSVSVSGDDVYVAGYEMINGKSVAMLWENGVGIQLSGGSSNANARSVFVVD